MVLLVVDTQKLLVNSELYSFENLVKNIRKLIDTARENNIEVVYVIHDDGVENDLTKGKDGFEVYEDFKPMEHEKVFIKNVNSAFRGTGLLEYLRMNDEKDIIIVGLQTDKCIDATIKCGFEHGFNMIVPSYTNSTVNNDFMNGEQSYKYYNEFMWSNRYAECISIDKVIEIIKS
ncbi:cysteine hydrolase family protein [Clostridium beijerinckii]|uniref:cysteine hydrolase family protein n=1 Tax=Clostridium beijerinckii TaxID=1520 RepID=UPI0022DEC10F|nr:cysteine hydrolase family protein [Clostridium beijerinckii]